ncbi:unnamed protein product [Triticum turgidum subsp. durum]|uniref:Uncharacterized protein n=1 Tax=Triticum turgidum subsp. durum TaxID=4567 RepID=A0A9R0V5W9_TRITD|nr:unnamed protein product [Triticum turgidum subsp. durum]
MNTRFVNLIVQDLSRRMYSLHRLDPIKYLFYPSTEARKAALAKTEKNKPPMLERLSVLPKPEINFHPMSSLTHSSMNRDSFSLLGKDSIVFSDSFSKTILYNIDLGTVASIPRINSCMVPFGMSLPMIQDNLVDRTEDQSLYVMDLSRDANISSCFEVLRCDDGWGWHTLPAPPFLTHNPSFQRTINRCCYMVVDSSTICISSMDQVIGTYTFDTVSRVWRQVGKWVLPFYGKAEYVPELKLWFGLSECNGSPRLCALDLSAMDAEQPPTLQHTWDYLDLFEDKKTVISENHLVNLGSGMFCIATLLRTILHTFSPDSPCSSGEEIMMDMMDGEFIFLTGVEVERCCNEGQAPFKMIKHKSIYYDLKHCTIKSVL